MSTGAPARSASLEQSVERFAAGEPVLVAGPDGRGAIVALPAAGISARRLAELHTLSGGIVVMALETKVAERLRLSALTGPTPRAGGLRLASPLDASDCRDGGWSLEDRAHTIRVAADPATEPGDLMAPGHVHAGLVDGAALNGPGAALELARRADQPGAVVLRALADHAGSPISLREIGREERLRTIPIAPVEELWWTACARLHAAESIGCRLPSRLGDFEIRAAVTDETGETVVMLVHGDPSTHPDPPVDTHTACLLGDTFGSRLCDCRAALERACERIRDAGAGTLVYIKPAAADPFVCPRMGRRG